jgi:hypothetical protein
MQLNLDRIPLRVAPEALTPIIAHGVGEDVAVFAEARCDDGAAYFGVAFQTMLGVFVPEVECAIGAGGGEGAVLGVEGDCVYGVDFCGLAGGRVLLAVALEREVEAAGVLVGGQRTMVSGNEPSVLLFDILNRTAALDATDGET